MRQEEQERQGDCEGERVRGGRCAEHEQPHRLHTWPVSVRRVAVSKPLRQPRPSFAEKTISRVRMQGSASKESAVLECFFCRILQSREAAAIPISVCKDTCLLLTIRVYIYKVNTPTFLEPATRARARG